MRKFVITTAVGLVGLSIAAASANAADLRRRPAPAPYVPPAFTWTGFYAGLNAGYGFSNDNNATTVGQVAINNATVADGARPALVGLRPEGFIGGGQIGYNWQTGPYVIGWEADIQGADIHDNVNRVTIGTAFPGVRNNFFDQRLEYLGTVRGRLGYAWDRTLIFGTGGFAYGGVKTSANFFGPLPGNILQFTGSHDSTETGYAVGGGIEQAFWQNWTLRAEYLYYDLGDTSVNVNVIPGSGGAGTGYITTFKNDGHIVRAALNYKFGW
jgi:outer membrane immunogenic protein